MSATATRRPEIPTRLLVHALLREDGTVDAGDLYTVANLLQMTDQQVRLCVKRLVDEGRFTQTGRGRKALLRAVSDPTGNLAPDADHVRFAYRQDAGLAPWDGTWRLFAFAIPEPRRSARDALRETLLRLGAAPLQGGLYVTANPVADVVEAHAESLDVLDSVTFLTSTDLRIGTITDPTAVAATLWPLGEIRARHEWLAAYAEQCLAVLDTAPATDSDRAATQRLTLAVELAAEFTRAMEPDPLLPPELLPSPWPGVTARHLAAACWERLDQAAPEETADVSRLRLFRLYSDLRPS